MVGVGNHPSELAGVRSDDMSSAEGTGPVTCSTVTGRIAARTLAAGNDADKVEC